MVSQNEFEWTTIQSHWLRSSYWNGKNWWTTKWAVENWKKQQHTDQLGNHISCLRIFSSHISDPFFSNFRLKYTTRLFLFHWMDRRSKHFILKQTHAHIQTRTSHYFQLLVFLFSESTLWKWAILKTQIIRQVGNFHWKSFSLCKCSTGNNYLPLNWP